MYAVPVLNAAPGLRVRCRTSRSPTTLDVGPAGQPVDGQHLGDQVDGVRRDRDDGERAGAGPGARTERTACRSGWTSSLDSATFLALLACQAQCGTRERHQPHLADRVAAGLADAVGAVVDPGQGPVDLGQLLALVVDARSAPGRARSWSRPCRPGRGRRRHRRRASARRAPPPGAVSVRTHAGAVARAGRSRTSLSSALVQALLARLDHQGSSTARPSRSRRLRGRPSWRPGAAFGGAAVFAGAAFFAGAFLAGRPSSPAAFLAGAPSWRRGLLRRAPSWPGAFFAGRLLRRRGLLRGRPSSPGGLLGRAPSSPGAFLAGRLLRRAPSSPGRLLRRAPSSPGSLLGRAPSSPAQPSSPGAFLAGAAFFAAAFLAGGLLRRRLGGGLLGRGRGGRRGRPPCGRPRRPCRPSDRVVLRAMRSLPGAWTRGGGATAVGAAP